jgi:hypothetical protein
MANVPPRRFIRPVLPSSEAVIIAALLRANPAPEERQSRALFSDLLEKLQRV